MKIKKLSLKKAISANRALAKLNGTAKIIPNQNILINALVLQEAKDSSEIENIITTHDELFRAGLDMKSVTHATKEVQHYREALLKGYAIVKESGLLLKRDIVQIQGILEQNDAGVRKQNGTVLKNQSTGEVVFEPPQEFETVHPFYDGNGRTGRIINILYLMLKGLLDVPILYLSSYIIQNKADFTSYHHPYRRYR